MEIDEWAIGQRIASHRVRRGITQDELAGLVGISLSMMKKIESGDRLVTRFSQMILFAQALRIKDLRELAGVPLPLMPDGRRGHPRADAVRAAVLGRGHGVEPMSLEDVRRRLDHAWSTWQAPSAFRYEAVGQALPELLGQTAAIVNASAGARRRAALSVASLSYQLARTWTKRVGEYELSLLVADRAVSCALDADDPQLAGAAAWNLAMILSAQGETGQAREVVRHAIDQLRPRTSDPTQAGLAVFGGLHLLAATEAAREDDADEAHRLLDEASAIAARTGETNHYRMVFGPTNVALHRISTTAELGRTAQALDLAERTAVESAASVERHLTYHLEAARCYSRHSNQVAAVYMLSRVHRDSPEELRYNSSARELLRQLSGKARPAVRVDLQPLMVAANLPD
ncbi:helix-turn-helix domain-containing protein [Mangrovihabitans endophyticus]|uniref:helix-turn-helix domain-containing protein n=1 Tax=Mangrovihabitans endophyticus TaxID=1751298 RepID=UPI00166F0E83|nr:helix-turn-helix transcriptional regulator [Mangrovihabitans endophyticus]